MRVLCENVRCKHSFLLSVVFIMKAGNLKLASNDFMPPSKQLHNRPFGRCTFVKRDNGRAVRSLLRCQGNAVKIKCACVILIHEWLHEVGFGAEAALTASQWLNKSLLTKLTDIFLLYGESNAS